MYFIILLIICFILGLILSKIDDKANQILNKINEVDKSRESYHRGFERSFTVLEKEIENLKEMVGEDNGNNKDIHEH